MDNFNDLSGGRPPLRVGILGAGRSTLNTHLPALAALPALFRVTAVCDLIKDRRDLVAKIYPELRPYRSCEDMLDDPDIDLFFIALPSPLHGKVALSALSRNRWTVVETPMALSHDQALVLRAAAVKSRNKLFPCLSGYFSPEFRLARMALPDPRLGSVYEAIVRRQDYIRRDDWQSIKRCGGGAAWYEGVEAMHQALALLGGQVVQLWGELKRVAALGDAEDTMHAALKGRGAMTAFVDIGGGRLDAPLPAFELHGTRGTFSVMPGADRGLIRAIDPDFKFPRRRSSVRTPALTDMHEEIPLREFTLALPDRETGAIGFWRAVYESASKAMPFPIAIDDAAEVIRYLCAIKKSSAFV